VHTPGYGPVIDCVSTVFTVMASESGNTQTLVISVCKTGLAGCVVLAGFLCTSVLQKKEYIAVTTVTSIDDILHLIEGLNGVVTFNG